MRAWVKTQQSHSAGTVVHLVCPPLEVCTAVRSFGSWRAIAVSKSLPDVGRSRPMTQMQVDR